jgi:hypothetical protein
LVGGGKFPIYGDPRRIRKDRCTGEQSKGVDEIRDGAAGFEREFESWAAEALGV